MNNCLSLHNLRTETRMMQLYTNLSAVTYKIVTAKNL
jgi:hypothetical protein